MVGWATRSTTKYEVNDALLEYESEFEEKLDDTLAEQDDKMADQQPGRYQPSQLRSRRAGGVHGPPIEFHGRPLRSHDR